MAAESRSQSDQGALSSVGNRYLVAGCLKSRLEEGIDMDNHRSTTSFTSSTL